MASPGIVFGGRDFNDFAAQVSVMRNQLNGQVEGNMSRILEESVAEMRQYVGTRGVKDHVPNSSGRIGETRALINSVRGKLDYSSSGRVRGSFGYINNTPRYAGYQEYGTFDGSGILPLRALADTYVHFKTKVENDFNNGRIVNLNGGRFAG